MSPSGAMVWRVARRMIAALWAASVLLPAASFAASPTPGVAGAPTPGVAREVDVKARYLALFARYVEWPADTLTRPLVVGVLGHDPFGGVLERTFRESFGEDRLVVVRRVASSAEARACHLVFISAQEERRRAVWLAELAGAPVLTVGEGEEALRDGAAVALVSEPGAGGPRLRFDVAVAAAEGAGLKISSRMLVSARRVRRAGDAAGGAGGGQ